MRGSLILIVGWLFLTPPLQAADEKVRLSISALDVSFLTAGKPQANFYVVDRRHRP